MDIYLYINQSPDSFVHKTLSNVGILSGSLRDGTNIVMPVVRIEAEQLPDFNYARIPIFERYYYKRDIKAVRSNIFDLYLKSDVLMSFDISDCKGILSETAANNSYNQYLNSRHFVNLVKDKTDILQFPNGLLENGEYILITAGGL